MARPVVTLLTDFGLVDPYVGMMKGVILGLCPEAAIVDITHDVPAQDIQTGAFLLERASRFFPAGSVHVAVVDPGVGTARRPLVIEAGDSWLVGPDNGLLASAARARGIRRIVHATDRNYFLPIVSNTFHGRDLFAPLAGHLARGVPAARMGKTTTRLVRLAARVPTRRHGTILGQVVLVDRFGNLVTNLQPEHLPRGRFRIRAGGFDAGRLRRSYEEVEPGALLVLVSSYGLLEIAARGGSAAARLGLGKGDRVKIIQNG